MRQTQIWGEGSIKPGSHSQRRSTLKAVRHSVTEEHGGSSSEQKTAPEPGLRGSEGKRQPQRHWGLTESDQGLKPEGAEAGD